MAPQQTSSCGTQVLQRTLGRWHPALLLQEDQPITCSQLGPGISIWPGRIVGSHEPQLPSNVISGSLACDLMSADAMRDFPVANNQASLVRSLGVRPDRGACPDVAIASWRPNAAAAPASLFQSGDAQSGAGLFRQSSIARFDSASSEAFQQCSTVDPATGLPPQPGAPMHAALHRYNSSLEGALSRQDSGMPSYLSREPSGGLWSCSSEPCLNSQRSSEPYMGRQHSSGLLWDSRHAEALASAVPARAEGSSRPAGSQLGPCGAEAMDGQSMYASEHRQVWMATPSQPVAPSHTLISEERMRAPRRKRHPKQPISAARRCLLDDFALAAQAEHWHLLSMEQAQARQPCSPMRAELAGSMPSPQLPGAPEDCMTSPQAVMMSASPDDTWQPGRLREVMQGFPNGLPMDDAEAVIVNVAYGLAEMHRDGIIHRHVCLSTVLVPDAPCFDTARLGEGGCTAVLDRAGTHTGLERVGDALYQAPEVQRPCPGSKLAYTAAGDMWSLGVLMYVVLTGGVPPFAHSLAQAGCRGMCADALQRLVSAALARGLAASALSEPLPRAAQMLLQSLLHVDPAQRPTAAAVCGHLWARDLPGSLLGTAVASCCSSPQQGAVPMLGMAGDLDGGVDREVAEQRAVECTSEAMQHLWLQQEALMTGDQESRDHMQRLLVAAHAGSAGRPGTYKGMLSWLQRVVGRCRRPEGRLPLHQQSSAHDLTELILQHY